MAQGRGCSRPDAACGRRLQLLLKYNPDWDKQPRVSAGNSDGGQWTAGSDGGNEAGNRTAVDPIQTQTILNSESERYSVNLQEEEVPIGIGHTIRKHVAKTDAELLQAIEANTYRGLFVSAIDYREGSFRSLEEANDFTNQVLQKNKAIVDLVASGIKDEIFVKERFGFVTGREAIRVNADSEPYMRNTYGVAVLIRHDSRVNRGYRVVTAYPRND